MLVKVYIFGKEINRRIYLWPQILPKSCIFEKIITKKFLGLKILCAFLKQIVFIKNCSKLVYTMLWPKSSDRFFVFSNSASLTKTWSMIFKTVSKMVYTPVRWPAKLSVKCIHGYHFCVLKGGSLKTNKSLPNLYPKLKAT